MKFCVYFFKVFFIIIFRCLWATRHPPKGIWNTTGSVSVCLMSDLEAFVEATILYGKLQIQFQKQILSTSAVRKIFVTSLFHFSLYSLWQSEYTIIAEFF